MDIYEKAIKKIEADSKNGPINNYYITEIPQLSYAYIYSIIDKNNLTILGNDSFKFDCNGYIKNINHIEGSDEIKITEYGIYNINYMLNYTSSNESTVALTINGVVEPTTINKILLENGSLSGNIILELKKNDCISLINFSANPINLIAQPNINIQMTITQLL